MTKEPPQVEPSSPELDPLNPSDALNELRRLVSRNQDRGVTEVVTWDLMDLFGALDSHLDEGGALPDQWRNRKRGRPRATEEGETLDGVMHGTRGGYNKGCRCNACRRANREHAAAFLAQQRQERAQAQLAEQQPERADLVEQPEEEQEA